MTPSNLTLNLAHAKAPSIQPIEIPKNIDTDKARDKIVNTVEIRQQKALAEQYIEITLSDIVDNANLVTLQEIAEFSKRVKAVQVIEDNNGNTLKELADHQKDRLENFFRGIENTDQSIVSRAIHLQA